MGSNGSKLWTGVKMCVSYFKNADGTTKPEQYDWYPKKPHLDIGKDTDQKMTVVRVESDCGADLAMRFSQDAIGISRDSILSWSGVILTEGEVRINLGEYWITVESDGTITKETDLEKSVMLPDGGILSDNPAVQTSISQYGEVSIIEK